LETVIDAVGRRLVVIAQTGALTTAEAITLTRHARDAGARAAAAVTPSYFGYDHRALSAYFGGIAKAVPDFPVLLYNIPGCTGNALSVALVLELAARHDNVVGIKDSSGDMAGMTRLLAAAPKGFSVISGSDLTMFQALAAGAHAVVSGPANVATPLCRAIYDNMRQGKLDLAWKGQVALARVVESLDYGGKIDGYKAGLRLRGVDAGCVRPPQRSLSAAEIKVLAEGLQAVGLMK
jgi:dihydrodipicolinate synthase/N-acetylneuraminate lyase